MVTSPSNHNPAIACLQEKHLQNSLIGVITHCDEHHAAYAKYGKTGFIPLVCGWTGLAVGLDESKRVINAKDFSDMRHYENENITKLPESQYRKRSFHKPGIASLREVIQKSLHSFYVHGVIGRVIHTLEKELHSTYEIIPCLGVPFERYRTKFRGHGKSDIVVRNAVHQRASRILHEQQLKLEVEIFSNLKKFLQPLSELHEKIKDSCKETYQNLNIRIISLRRLAAGLFQQIRKALVQLDEQLSDNRHFAKLIAASLRSALEGDTSMLKLSRFPKFIDFLVNQAMDVVTSNLEKNIARCVRSCLEYHFKEVSQVFRCRDGHLIYKMADGTNPSSLVDVVEFELAEAFDSPNFNIVSILPSIEEIDITEDNFVQQQRKDYFENQFRRISCIRDLRRLRSEEFNKDIEASEGKVDAILRYLFGMKLIKHK